MAEYVHGTDNHVMYRVTPIFENENLVASGVQMEAESVEDGGKESSLMFMCTIYSRILSLTIKQEITEQKMTMQKEAAGTSGAGKVFVESEYILNTSTHKFHRPDCAG